MIKKDFTKKSVFKNTVEARRLRTILLVVVIATICTLGFFIQQNKNKLIHSQDFANYVSKFKNWNIFKKNSVQNELEDKQKIAGKSDNNASSIHFEFYSTLPKMQITAEATDTKP